MENREKTVAKYARLYAKALARRGFADVEAKTAAYRQRLTEMYASEAFAKHNVYPTMDVVLIYAVVAMCLELKGFGLGDEEIMAFSDEMFAARKRFFAALEKCVDVLPNSYRIAEKWNIGDHDKRVEDGSIDFDLFRVEPGHIEYRITGCRYVDIFEHYGIRRLCRIFCKTDEAAYASLTRHVTFIRHSELATGDSCHDEIFDADRAKAPRNAGA